MSAEDNGRVIATARFSTFTVDGARAHDPHMLVTGMAAAAWPSRGSA
jgi:hypothetical protein